MSARIRAYDWSQTPLGPIEDWPVSLRTIVSAILAAPYPMTIIWSADLILLYNDAYAVIAGAKHPQALGQPASMAFAEIWVSVQDLLHGIMSTGKAVTVRDMPFILERHGFPEETYIDAGISAIRDEANGIGGIYISEAESTFRVLAERRIATLSALAAEHAATAVGQACERALSALAANASDIPFALLYLLDESGTMARLAGSVGLDGAASVDGAAFDRIRPATVELTPSAEGAGDARGWPLAAAWRTGQAVELADLEQRFGALPGGPWPEPARTALVLPLVSPTRERPAGFLILSASPRLRFDDAYREFFGLVAGQIAGVIANAQAHEQERQRVEALAALDRAKTAFFSNVSHEFRTPLTLLLGPLRDSLDDQREPLPPEQRERMEIAQRNAQRLLKLVNSLLDFSRIEAGRAQASYEPIDVASATAELASAFRSAIERAGLKLIVDCPPLSGLSQPVYVDRDMWEKIVLNLLSNAFKYTVSGQISVRVRPSARGDAVTLEVRDTGVGIPAEELPHIFERFHRVEGTRGRTHEGSGIGLALTRELVLLHGGEISVQSVEGAGATFTVTLPTGTAHLPAERIRQSGAAPAATLGAAPFVEEALRWLPDAPPEIQPAPDGPPAPALAATPQTPAMTPAAHILLVDDNADMRLYARRLLRDAGWSVETASNGAEALAAAQRRIPDLVVADVMMPVLDGIGLLRALRADPRTRLVPVVLLSARAGEEAKITGLETGADDYIVKPFSAPELVARIRARLELARARHEAASLERRLESAHATANARELTLLETNRQMEEFLMRVSHELRTPLTSVKANIQILNRSAAQTTATPAHSARLLERTEAQIRRLERLMNDLLDLNSIQVDQLDLRLEPIDLTATVRAAVEEQQRVYPTREIRLETPPAATPLLARADAGRIAQVVGNYLTNALTYSMPDQPVTVSVSAEGSMARVSVRDHGIGIPQEEQARIWERFQRREEQSHLSGSRIGLGLGLYIAKAIVERHAGAVGVESQPGAGATFWFTLPLLAG